MNIFIDGAREFSRCPVDVYAEKIFGMNFVGKSLHFSPIRDMLKVLSPIAGDALSTRFPAYRRSTECMPLAHVLSGNIIIWFAPCGARRTDLARYNIQAASDGCLLARPLAAQEASDVHL